MVARKPLVAINGQSVELPAADTLASGLRVETYTSTACDANGAATITFSAAFKTAPTVIPLANLSGTTVMVAKAGAPTTTGCALTIMTSRGTLLLSAGPFAAAAGSTVQCVVIGT